MLEEVQLTENIYNRLDKARCPYVIYVNEKLFVRLCNSECL